MYRGHRVHPFHRNALALIALIAPLCATAQVDPGLPELPPPVRTIPTPEDFAAQQMKALDTDRDNKITWPEFSARLRKAFDDMDRKKRGYLTSADLRAAYERALAQARPNGQ